MLKLLLLCESLFYREAACRTLAGTGTTTSQVETGMGRMPAGHAPVGPLCARIAEGVPLERPADCVG